MRYKIDTIEPMWWGLFMAGAGVAGLFLPIHILINGLLIPLGLVPRDEVANRLATLITNPIVKLYLLVLISLPLFHWAHRFRYFLFDLGLHGARMPLAVLCYGAAIVGTVVAILTLIKL
jgi:fumarate reductase subunit D